MFSNEWNGDAFPSILNIQSPTPISFLALLFYVYGWVGVRGRENNNMNSKQSLE